MFYLSWRIISAIHVDAAYAWTEGVMKSHSKVGITAEQKQLNKRVSKIRISSAEQSFGKLKSTFQYLNYGTGLKHHVHKTLMT